MLAKFLKGDPAKLQRGGSEAANRRATHTPLQASRPSKSLECFQTYQISSIWDTFKQIMWGGTSLALLSSKSWISAFERRQPAGPPVLQILD